MIAQKNTMDSGFFRLAVLDGYTLNPGDLSWDELHSFGVAAVYDRTPRELILSRAANYDILLTNKTPLTAETIRSLPSLKYIGVLATGFNVVDIEAASDAGVIVTNIPSYGTQSVAQMVFAHLLGICHHVSAHDQAVREGEWARSGDFCFWKYPLIELSGKTMGIIGMGRIGQAVAQIAHAFGMKIIAADPDPNPALVREDLRFVSIEELLAGSDVISLHCPLTPETQGLINRNTLSRMKDGVILINTSRGQLIVEEDLAEALRSGKVYAAGLDVLQSEPPAPDNPLLNLPNCTLTPHIAWAPREARQRLMNIAMDNIRAFLSGSPVNVVNPNQLP